jgi:LemA protein
MSTSKIVLFSFAGLLLIMLFWTCSSYNGLVTNDNDIKGKWGTVQTQYNRKAKLYGDMVETIKGAAKNEDTTLMRIVQMRSGIPQINENSTPEQVAAADQQWSAVGKAIKINVEAYPTLKATDLFRDFQTVQEGTENRVQIALKDWNDVITNYNNRVMRFPGNIIANMFGFQPKKNYEAPPGAEDVKVNFTN